jgi:16S rRNA (cytidine1402-2'-O)-methyltransferase
MTAPFSVLPPATAEAPTGLPAVSPAAQALAAAAALAGHQDLPAGCLYVVATPIGNLADMTLRALHALARCDAVACEDTRVSGALLRHFGLEKPLLAVHKHNERAAARGICARLAAGERVAYVSDAGTPAVSDPGAALVDEVVAAGHRVLPLPGASSAVTALSVAGDAHALGFMVAGFLSSKAQERAGDLALWRDATCSVVLFEAPHRIEALAAAMREVLGGTAVARRVTVCRELTKQFEEIATMAIDAFPGWLAADANRRRGEFVVVLHAAPPAAAVDEGIPPAAEHCLRTLLAELPLKQAASLAAEITGLPRKRLYQQALAWKPAEPADDEDH